MAVTLKKAAFEDCVLLHDLQVRSFKALLDKYQDYDYNPGAENLERIIERFKLPNTDYYLILLDDLPIGGLRVYDFGERCVLKQIFILPEHQNHGFAQQAITQVESLYPNAEKWCLDTILQENKLCHLYEKIGYCKTGQTKNLQPGMDLVFYDK